MTSLFKNIIFYALAFMNTEITVLGFTFSFLQFFVVLAILGIIVRVVISVFE